MRTRRRLRTILAACIVGVPALLAAADIGTVTPAVATFGTHVSVDGTGFGTAKAPKAKLVPQTPGNKTLPLRVASFSDTHLDLVVKSVKLDQTGAYDLVITPAGKSAPVFTKTGAVAIGYPNIVTFTPQSSPGGQATIYGTSFGPTKRGGFVKVGNKKAKIVSWSDTQIVLKLSKKTPLGGMPVWVHTKVGNHIPQFGMIIAK